MNSKFERALMRGWAKNFRECLATANGPHCADQPWRRDYWLIRAGENLGRAKLVRDSILSHSGGGR